MKPRIYITNWPSKRLHGTGLKFTIMAKPRSWEHGDGVLSHFVPPLDALAAYKAGRINWDEYHRQWLEHVYAYSIAIKELGGTGSITPGHLAAVVGETSVLVADGDTLCHDDICHRQFAASLLSSAGWHVILDGKDYINIQINITKDDNEATTKSS